MDGKRLKEKIELILVGAILEYSDSKVDFIVDCFHSAMSILMSGEGIFESVPKEVVKSSEDLAKIGSGTFMTGLEKDLLTNQGEENDKEIIFFKNKGVLIYDGLYASAFGRMSYFYRSKGIRVYLLGSSKILIVCPYSYIDHEGFSFVQEKVEKIKLSKIKNEDEIQYFLSFTNGEKNEDGKVRVNEKLIKMLTSVKKPFRKDYYLEYMITPPDVDKLSAFSESIKQEFWNVCLSEEFKGKWGEEMQGNAISFLSYMKIPPSPTQILDYVKSSVKDERTNKIIDAINMLEYNLTNQKEDLVEFKPSIAGVSVNVNEMVKRLAKKIYIE